MHAVGPVEQDAAFGRDGGVTLEKVFETGEAGVARVAALGRLGELHLIADEDQVAGGEANRDRVGEENLSRLGAERPAAVIPGCSDSGWTPSRRFVRVT